MRYLNLETLNIYKDAYETNSQKKKKLNVKSHLKLF